MLESVCGSSTFIVLLLPLNSIRLLMSHDCRKTVVANAVKFFLQLLHFSYSDSQSNPFLSQSSVWILRKKGTPCKGIPSPSLQSFLRRGNRIKMEKERMLRDVYKAVWDALMKSLMLIPVEAEVDISFRRLFSLPSSSQQRKKETRLKWWRCCRDSVLWGIWKIIRFDSYLFSFLWGFSHISCLSCCLSLIQTKRIWREQNEISFDSWTRFLFPTPFIPWNSLVSNACSILLSDNETQMFLQSVDKDKSKSDVSFENGMKRGMEMCHEFHKTFRAVIECLTRNFMSTPMIRCLNLSPE